MRIDKQRDEQAPSLILCLSGWSAPPELFRHLNVPEGMDLWIAYDYRNLSFEEDLTRYESVHLVAWSLGVWVADFLWAGRPAFASATAINGTPFPIDDQRGIPVRIFEGTLANLDEESLRRFNQRMCGDRATFARYTGLPARPLQETREELSVLRDRILAEKRIGTMNTALAEKDFWNLTIISTGDRIFPPENEVVQQRWEGDPEEICDRFCAFLEEKKFLQQLR